jgi:transcriptional regulator with XRE-family HTH domain
MTIGPVLKEAREKAGLTQQDLADRAGVHRVYVSMLERDEKSPTLDVFFRLCRALGVRPRTLVQRVEQANE